MAKRTNYTQRTLKRLRDSGIFCEVVERYIHFGKFGVRKDFLGFIDIIGLDKKSKKIIGIQSTGQHGHADHKKKIMSECKNQAKMWLKCGGEIQLWSWRKLKVKRGGKAVKWEPRIEIIDLQKIKEYGI